MLQPVSSALLYGKGIFTTIAICGGEPFLWEKHWRRLNENAAKLRIDISQYSEDGVRQQLLRKVNEAGIPEGRARVSLLDGSATSVWPSAEDGGTELEIVVGERRDLPKDLKLTVSPHRANTTSPLAGVKSCNYLEQLLAFDEARERGFHEAVRLNERGEIASASVANIFWSIDGKLYTPSLSTGCLDGTTRSLILDVLKCEEVAAGIDELGAADRIFLTSAGIGVKDVAEFDGRTLDTGEHAMLTVLPFRCPVRA